MLQQQVLANHLLLRLPVPRRQRTSSFPEEGAQCRQQQQERQLHQAQDFSHTKRRAKTEALGLERRAKLLLVLRPLEATVGTAIRLEVNLHQILRAHAQVTHTVDMLQDFALVPAHQMVQHPKPLLVQKLKSQPRSRLQLLAAVKMLVAKR